MRVGAVRDEENCCRRQKVVKSEDLWGRRRHINILWAAGNGFDTQVHSGSRFQSAHRHVLSTPTMMLHAQGREGTTSPPNLPPPPLPTYLRQTEPSNLLAHHLYEEHNFYLAFGYQGLLRSKCCVCSSRLPRRFGRNRPHTRSQPLPASFHLPSFFPTRSFLSFFDLQQRFSRFCWDKLTPYGCGEGSVVVCDK